MMKFTFHLCLFIATNLIGVPLIADTLYVTLDVGSLTGSPDSSVTFSGSILNNSGGDVYLNGVGADLLYSELTFDPTPFFALVPLVLSDGDSYTGALFSIAISLSAVAGDYSGVFFIQGGADSSTFDTAGSVTFQVNVSDIPEPTTAAFFLATGCCFLLLHILRFIVPGGWG